MATQPKTTKEPAPLFDSPRFLHSGGRNIIHRSGPETRQSTVSHGRSLCAGPAATPRYLEARSLLLLDHFTMVAEVECCISLLSHPKGKHRSWIFIHPPAFGRWGNKLLQVYIRGCISFVEIPQCFPDAPAPTTVSHLANTSEVLGEDELPRQKRGY